MLDFDRSLERTNDVTYFVTTCHECGAVYRSHIIGKMPEWEHQHEMNCPALEALEA